MPFLDWNADTDEVIPVAGKLNPRGYIHSRGGNGGYSVLTPGAGGDAVADLGGATNAGGNGTEDGSGVSGVAGTVSFEWNTVNEDFESGDSSAFIVPGDFTFDTTGKFQIRASLLGGTGAGAYGGGGSGGFIQVEVPSDIGVLNVHVGAAGTLGNTGEASFVISEDDNEVYGLGGEAASGMTGGAAGSIDAGANSWTILDSSNGNPGQDATLTGGRGGDGGGYVPFSIPNEDLVGVTAIRVNIQSDDQEQGVRILYNDGPDLDTGLIVTHGYDGDASSSPGHLFGDPFFWATASHTGGVGTNGNSTAGGSGGGAASAIADGDSGGGGIGENGADDDAPAQNGGGTGEGGGGQGPLAVGPPGSGAEVDVYLEWDEEDMGAPVISSNGGGSTANISIAENITAVTIVEASSDSVVTYSITGGSDSSKFSIDSETGVLRFLTAPDYETPTDVNTDNVYTVIVTATDQEDETDSQTINVTITDLNEIPPSITSNGGGASASISVAENSTSAVTTVVATGDSPITYSLSGTDASSFTINSSTGVLHFASVPDRENPTDADQNNVYLINVLATNPYNVDSQALTITVTNVVEGTANADLPIDHGCGFDLNDSALPAYTYLKETFI